MPHALTHPARRFDRHPAPVALALLLAAHWLPAQAQSCHVSGAFGMNFGTVTASGKSATSSVTYVCAPDYSGGQTYYYQVCLYLGPGDWSAGQPTRRMTNYNGAYLDYDLFADPAHTQLIGGVGTTPVYQQQVAVAPGVTETYHAPVYGQVYAGQSVPAVAGFQEQGIQGLLRWRYGTAAVPAASDDCSSGGNGGGSLGFSSSGVLATFENACWVSAADLDFGSVTPPEHRIDVQSEIRLQCPVGTAWRLGLDNGQHYAGGQRRMARTAGGFVAYELYRDPERTQAWGNTDDSMASGSVGADGSAVNVSVYGAVPPQPDAVPGVYRDVVVVTLYY